ncbi:MAG: nicotinate (nicotinamide) nucleotide adenylyltransferase [Thermoleophilia bacterium]|nr:nicotinate (nicotinamide) nucleotide adenylyltransferase [Thermoleophilia bacterium]
MTGPTGLLGGAFDPPHNGHLVLADEAVRQFRLERLVVVVTGLAPHKNVETDPETRFRLAAAAFAGLPGVELSRHELDRPGPSYTVDTARWAGERYGEAIFLVGADEFASFLDWKEPDEVLRYVRLGVATRPGFPRALLESVLARLERPGRVELFEIPALPVSSTGVRERAAAGLPIDGLVPPAVAALVAELGLYGRLDPRPPASLG